MGNLKQKYTDEDWEEMEEAIKADNKAKEQAIKDMEGIDWSTYEEGFKNSIEDLNEEEDE